MSCPFPAGSTRSPPSACWSRSFGSFLVASQHSQQPPPFPETASHPWGEWRQICSGSVDVIRAAPLKAFPQGKSKPHKTPNGTSQRQPAAEIHCAHFSNLLHAHAVGTKYNLRIALCLQQQRPWQKGRSCSSKGRRLEQQPLQYLWGSPSTAS